MATQANRTQRLAAANDVVVNETSLEALRAELKKLHQRYLGLAHEKQSQPHSQKA
jgi:dephospho-CoA kinase